MGSHNFIIVAYLSIYNSLLPHCQKMWNVFILLNILALYDSAVAATFKARSQGRAQLKGSACDYISLCRVSCPDGSKFVVKQAKGVRKQFLVLDGESVLAFVAKKSDQNNAVKFSQCPSYRFSLSSPIIGSHLSYCRDITHD